MVRQAMWWWATAGAALAAPFVAAAIWHGVHAHFATGAVILAAVTTLGVVNSPAEMKRLNNLAANPGREDGNLGPSSFLDRPRPAFCPRR